MKSNAFKITATIFLAILGILFTAGMRAFGAALAGGGAGSRFFLFLVAGPEGILLLVWPILFALLPWTRLPKIALTAVILALIPVLWVAVVLGLEGVQDDILQSIWKSARPVIYIFGALFLLPTLLGLLTGLRATIQFFKE